MEEGRFIQNLYGKLPGLREFAPCSRAGYDKVGFPADAACSLAAQAFNEGFDFPAIHTLHGAGDNDRFPGDRAGRWARFFPLGRYPLQKKLIYLPRYAGIGKEIQNALGNDLSYVRNAGQRLQGSGSQRLQAAKCRARSRAVFAPTLGMPMAKIKAPRLGCLLFSMAASRFSMRFLPKPERPCSRSGVRV